MKNLINKTALTFIICGLTLTAAFSHGEVADQAIFSPSSQSTSGYSDCVFIVVNGMGQWVCF